MNYEPNYRICKNRLKNILKNHFYGEFFHDDYQNISQSDVLKIIEDAVIRTNIIVFHTYNFLNLYFLHLYEQNLDLPFIDKDLIKTIMMIVSVKGDARGRPPADDKKETIIGLLKFFRKYYHPLLNKGDIVSNHKLSYVLDKESEDMVKNINNNIKEHFIDHVRKYINDLTDIKELIRNIESNKKLSYQVRKEKIYSLRNEWNSFKHDVLATKDFINTDPEKLLLIRLMKQKLLPYQNFLKDSIYYDLEVNPQNYLKSMITINREINKLSKVRDKKYKLFHVLPLRSSIEPKYITLNTNAISSIFSGKAIYQNNTSEKENEIWNSLFNIDTRCFKYKGYQFANVLKTDGIACSIIFQELTIQQKKKIKIVPIQNKINQPLDWDNYLENKEKNKKNRRYLTKKERENYQYNGKDNIFDSFHYIENIKVDHIHNRTMVYIDPGHHSLAECMSEKCINDTVSKIKYLDNKVIVKTKQSTETFLRYTRAQRNRESKKFRYQKILGRIKNEDIIKLETDLSKYNSKICYFKEFQKYLKEKIKLNRKLYQHYQQPIYRKLKFNRYINYRKSEEKFIKNFKEKYGRPNSVTIIFGDYSKKDTMKGSEPHLVKHLKKLFRLHHYQVYLIDEYNTSKLCNRCSCELERFKWVKNKHGSESLLWRLLRCTSEKCLTYHNRDHNATRNMMKIVKTIMDGKRRPKEYCRKDATVFPKRIQTLDVEPVIVH